MAEAVGLAFGALALLSAVKDCIDLFSTISAAKSLSSDYELLNTKLDIEKLILLQWVDRVRLGDDQNYDRRLDEPRTNKGVSSILCAIRLLLSESSQLQTRYGMKRVEVETTVDRTISEPRMRQFVRDFENMSLRIHARQKNASLKQRFCWIIGDREKFSILIQELSDLIKGLNAIVPPTQDQFVLMTKTDLESIGSIRQVQLVLEAAKEHETMVADLAQADINRRCQDRVLHRLRYRGVDERKNNIADAHSNTLQWALHPPTSDVEWDDLGHWLRSGSRTFWISGKAGSGKSTLMKWLYQNEGTRRMLETWLPGRRLVVAYFFIWGLGSPEQKTQEGLHRGLLYSILNADPSLIPQVLPAMWRDAVNADKIDLELPSPHEMGEAFSALKSKTMKHKFCFFIDGLDEFAGNLIHGIDFIDSLVSSSNIKLVVSSRPIPACVQAFSDSPKLKLEDLTRDDIKAYIDATIGSHPHIRDLMKMAPQSVRKILGDLVDKASGVFLWVVLACRSLLDGFAACDYPDELQQRVDELPPELEKLFQHMLGKIEPRYQVQAARLLRICYLRRLHSGSERDHRASPWVYESIYTLGLASVDGCDLDMRRTADLHRLSLEDRRTMCKVLEARLRSRCCGLLEVHRVKDTNKCCFCGYLNQGDPPTRPHDTLVDSTVEFMHRSVFEFLGDSDAWKLQCLQTSGIGFDAYGILSQTSMHLAYACAGDTVMSDLQINGFTREALLFARYADDHSSEATVPVLYHLLQMSFDLSKTLSNISNFCNRYPFFAEISRLASQPQYAEAQLALILAVELGMLNVVKQLHFSELISSDLKAPLLWHAINRPCLYAVSSAHVDISPDMIAFLLSIECDPNMMVVTSCGIWTTPWSSWLQYLEISKIDHTGSIIADITELLIRAGADVNVLGPESGRSLETLVENCLTRSTPNTKSFNQLASLAPKNLFTEPYFPFHSNNNVPPKTNISLLDTWLYAKGPWLPFEATTLITDSRTLVTPLTRGERAMKARCNKIIQLIADKRLNGNHQAQDNWPDHDRPLSRLGAPQMSDSGTTACAAISKKQRKRPLPSEPQVSGESAHSDVSSRPVKRKRRGRRG